MAFGISSDKMHKWAHWDFKYIKVTVFIEK
jgi:hypothetical protein